MLKFITQHHVDESIKAVLFPTNSDEPVNQNVVGAVWAALHEGYRGYKYDGPSKQKAIANLRKLFSESPEKKEEVGAFFEEALRKDDSFDSIRCKVSAAIQANIAAGVDMDGDDDGVEDAKEGAYAWIMDLFPGDAVYSMCGKLMQVPYTTDADGDVHLGSPVAVEMTYTPIAKESATVSFQESCSFLEANAYSSDKGELTITVIRPGLSKNNRYYSADLLRRHHKMFEGAKMFVDHQTESEDRQRPEGSIRDWVANVGNTWVEADGTVKAKAIVIDPPFKAKLDRLRESGLLEKMGTSIRAMGESSDKIIDGKNARVVESFTAVRSVDFVTFAGAGGMVEAIE